MKLSEKKYDLFYTASEHFLFVVIIIIILYYKVNFIFCTFVEIIYKRAVSITSLVESP